MPALEQISAKDLLPWKPYVDHYRDIYIKPPCNETGSAETATIDTSTIESLERIDLDDDIITSCADFSKDEKTIVVVKELHEYIVPMKQVLNVIDEFFIENELE